MDIFLCIFTWLFACACAFTWFWVTWYKFHKYLIVIIQLSLEVNFIYTSLCLNTRILTCVCLCPKNFGMFAHVSQEFGQVHMHLTLILTCLNAFHKNFVMLNEVFKIPTFFYAFHKTIGNLMEIPQVFDHDYSLFTWIWPHLYRFHQNIGIFSLAYQRYWTYLCTFRRNL